jgi:hypothetical protein
MKTILLVLAMLMSSAVLAQDRPQPTASKSLANPHPVETQVRTLWEAFKNKDKATLSALLDDHFRMFEEGLATFGDKKAEVNAADEYELLSYTLSDFVVKPISSDAALVTYNAQYEGKSGGEVLKGKSVFGEVWIRSGGKWKSLYLQETYVK